MDSAPVVIGFDGSPAAERAIRDSAALLGTHPALVVTVWEAGRSFAAATAPIVGLQPAPIMLDIRGALVAEAREQEVMQITAQRGAQLAREAGYADATGLAVAEDATVAATLIRVATERHSPGLVVGAHGHSRVAEFLLGSTSRALVARAPCPVVVTGPHGS
ncbi:universal stress protein [Dactylosporangium darangshiense]|jgi:nucleotide-binding universal stress UspA family protein|uniref:UspA domain-containing protein n=1 Tax=Dactylosporangium darangshiense TaxID=579108 RepID=A0ABP8D4K9_9ACTN|nr:universal stress protein [Dactylosporangium sp.]